MASGTYMHSLAIIEHQGLPIGRARPTLLLPVKGMVVTFSSWKASFDDAALEWFKILNSNPLDWVTPKKGSWTIDLDALRNYFDENLEYAYRDGTVQWPTFFRGKVDVRPSWCPVTGKAANKIEFHLHEDEIVLSKVGTGNLAGDVALPVPKADIEFAKRPVVAAISFALTLVVAGGAGFKWLYEQHQHTVAIYGERSAQTSAILSGLRTSKKLYDQLAAYKIPPPGLDSQSGRRLGILQSYVELRRTNPHNPDLERMKGLITKLVERNEQTRKALDELAQRACTAQLQAKAEVFDHEVDDFGTQWSAAEKYIDENASLKGQVPFDMTVYDALDIEAKANRDRTPCDNPGAR